MRPSLVVPRSRAIASMLDDVGDAARAVDIGVLLVAPHGMRAVDAITACYFWPRALTRARVSRIAVLLDVTAYVTAERVLAGCRARMASAGVEAAYFHEGHLESDQIAAWFERRRPRRRVTSDALMKLSQRYAIRGDITAARHAQRLAEVAAGAHACTCRAERAMTALVTRVHVAA